jgi:transcriptional regulator with XRE-family HTH domain
MGDQRRQRPQEMSRFGARLSEWRARRRVSQLSLAVDAGVSQRHLSFVESGRSQPSREMVLRLCGALEIPLRHRNEMFVLAGYAPYYPHLSLDDTEMRGIRDALQRVIEFHEPYPAFVLDREWRVLLSNRGAQALVSACLDARTLESLSRGGFLNFMRMVFEPTMMRPRIRNWERVAPKLIARLLQEAQSDPFSPSSLLLQELSPGTTLSREHEIEIQPLSPAMAVELEINGSIMKLFNTITTFGTPQDVGLQELRIEMSYPLDSESAAQLRMLQNLAPPKEGAHAGETVAS